VNLLASVPLSKSYPKSCVAALAFCAAPVSQRNQIIATKQDDFPLLAIETLLLLERLFCCWEVAKIKR